VQGELQKRHAPLNEVEIEIGIGLYSLLLHNLTEPGGAFCPGRHYMGWWIPGSDCDKCLFRLVDTKARQTDLPRRGVSALVEFQKKDEMSGGRSSV